MHLKRTGDGQTARICHEDTVPYVSFPLLEEHKDFLHGFSTRLGGVSTEHLSSMNLSFTRGDDPERVRENYRRIAGSIGFRPEDMVLSAQTHTTHVRKVTEADRGMGFTRPLEYADVDGLMTNVPGIVLVGSFADCVPLYFIDPVEKVAALSHSGWKGTAHRMGRVTVEAMEREYGCRPENLYAVIGPSICRECYEVSEDVLMQIEAIIPEEQASKMYEKKENGRYQLDLWKVNEQILLDAGIPKEHIAVTDVCTCCNPEIFFSHRASRGQRGNMAAFLGIRRPEDSF
ncbi:MAG TPA: peptidoglycan editing factor PgeF [Candidatus Limivivens intestinipullorum]|uniref:Purine nucleoside phosphorylase n=1 Tax=Candidatus Limivivens intestinipullorum TaxID=2840858 RepID=A0A9D1ERQ2_9FIRM|nr:peptidoglycan editing factor PgeF [Candidatus Limivivens intestinipullorum]